MSNNLFPTANNPVNNANTLADVTPRTSPKKIKNDKNSEFENLMTDKNPSNTTELSQNQKKPTRDQKIITKDNEKFANANPKETTSTTADSATKDTTSEVKESSNKNTPQQTDSLKKVKQLIGVGSAATKKSEALAFMTGQTQNMNPEAILNILTNNSFVQNALSEDISLLMQEPIEFEELLEDLGFSNEIMSQAAFLGLNLDDKIAPKDFLKAIGIDPHQVISQLTKIKNELPAKGLAGIAMPTVVSKDMSPVKEPSITGSQKTIDELKKKKNQINDNINSELAGLQTTSGTVAANTFSNQPQMENPELKSQPKLQKNAGITTENNLALDLNKSILKQETSPTFDPLPPQNIEEKVAPKSLELLSTKHINNESLNTPLIQKTDIDPFEAIKKQMSETSVISFEKDEDVPFASQTLAASKDGNFILSKSSPLGINTEQKTNVLPPAPLESLLIKDMQLSEQSKILSDNVPFSEKTPTKADSNLLTQKSLLPEQTGLKLFDTAIPVEKDIIVQEKFSNLSDQGDKSSFGEKQDNSSKDNLITESKSEIKLPQNPFAQNFNTTLISNENESLSTNTIQDNFTQNVLQKAKMMTHEGGGSAILDLSSPELGQLSLAIQVEDDKVQLRIVAASEKAKHMISSEMNRLFDSMASQSLHLKTIEMATADSSFNNRQDQNNQNFFFQQGQQGFQQQNSSADQFLTNTRNNLTDAANNVKQKIAGVKTSFNPTSKIQVAA